MKLMQILILLATSVGCMPRPYMQDLDNGRSGVSDVVINIPKGAQLHSSFGANCSDFNPAPALLARLGTQDRCQAIDRLLDGFQLTMEHGQCEAGVKGESSSLVGKLSQIKPKEKVTKGCTYSVSLELGEIDDAKIYFSNVDSAKDNLIVKRDAPGLISMKIEVKPTKDGIALGFKSNESIDTIAESSDLNIDISFGKSAR